MYAVRGKLTPEVGVLLMRAIEAASDQIYRRHRIKELDTERAAAQRRADALGLLAERAMAAGLGGRAPEAGSGRGADRDGGEGAGRGDGGAEPGDGGDAGMEGDASERAEAPISGTRAGRYQVVLHVDAATLAAEGEPGRSELEDGTRVSAETSRRISCDAGLVRITHAPDGSVLDVGRRTRTIPPALRRVLEARDRGCRFPGCGLRFTDGHHVKHWADGGPTSLANTVLLCKHHHTLVHEGGWKIDWWGEGRPVFFGPRGQLDYEGRWQPPELPEDVVEALLEENRALGIEPDWRTAGARWKREEDIPDRVLFRAMEALE
jgi:hypothetical protein